MRRKLFNSMALVSLLMCVATGVLWVLSLHSFRLVSWYSADARFVCSNGGLAIGNGEFLFDRASYKMTSMNDTDQWLRHMGAVYQDNGYRHIHDRIVYSSMPVGGRHGFSWHDRSSETGGLISFSDIQTRTRIR